MILGLTLIAYGIARFGLESLRDDNPFEYAWWMLYKGGTISQNISLYLILLGAILLAVTAKIEPPIPKKGRRRGHPAAEKAS